MFFFFVQVLRKYGFRSDNSVNILHSEIFLPPYFLRKRRRVALVNFALPKYYFVSLWILTILLLFVHAFFVKMVNFFIGAQHSYIVSRNEPQSKHSSHIPSTLLPRLRAHPLKGARALKRDRTTCALNPSKSRSIQF